MLYPYQIVGIKCEFELISFIHDIPIFELFVACCRAIRQPSRVNVRGVDGHAVVLAALGKDVHAHHGAVGGKTLDAVKNDARIDGLRHLDFLYLVRGFTLRRGLVDFVLKSYFRFPVCCDEPFQQNIISGFIVLRTEIVLDVILAGVFVFVEFQTRDRHLFHRYAFASHIFRSENGFLVYRSFALSLGHTAHKDRLCGGNGFLLDAECAQSLVHDVLVGKASCRKFFRKAFVRLRDVRPEAGCVIPLFLVFELVCGAEFLHGACRHACDHRRVHRVMDVAVFTDFAYAPLPAKLRRYAAVHRRYLLFADF